MIAFGGSGPAHAIRIARKLRIPKVVFPVGAGVMSAIGLLMTPISYATLRSGRVNLEELDADGLDAGFNLVERQARCLLAAAGIDDAQIQIDRRLDMRYCVQGHEVEVPRPPGIDRNGIADLFSGTYAKIFAATPIDTGIEIVNWKVEASGPEPEFADRYRPFSGALTSQDQIGEAGIFCDDATGLANCPVYDRYALDQGQRITGPALVQENEATTVLSVGDTIEVDDMGNLIATLAGETS